MSPARLGDVPALYCFLHDLPLLFGGRSTRGLLPMLPGGLNGSSQHQDGVLGRGIPKAKKHPRTKSEEKASCLGKSELQPQSSVHLKRIARSNDQRGVASTV